MVYAGQSEPKYLLVSNPLDDFLKVQLYIAPRSLGLETINSKCCEREGFYTYSKEKHLKVCEAIELGNIHCKSLPDQQNDYYVRKIQMDKCISECYK